MVINHYNFAGSNKQITPKGGIKSHVSKGLIHWMLSDAYPKGRAYMGRSPPRGKTCFITFDEVQNYLAISKGEDGD